MLACGINAVRAALACAVLLGCCVAVLRPSGPAGTEWHQPQVPTDAKVQPLLQVTRLTGDHTVQFPTAHEAALRGEIAPTLIRSDHCNQKESCDFFSDLLVVVHVNPQRLEWLETVLDYALHFVPTIMITTLPRDTRHPDQNLTMSADELRAHLGHAYIGEKRRYVHIIDTGLMGLLGEHNDVVTAMRLYPNFRGYLYWMQEDVLPGFWNFPTLDKERPWYQNLTELFAFQFKRPLCPTYSSKHRGRMRRINGMKCISPMKAHHARDWRKLYPAFKKIQRDSPADYSRIVPAAGLGINMYYVPRNMFHKFERYSAYMFEAEGYNEFATGALLQAAVAEGQRKASFAYVNIWADSRPLGRFHPQSEFRWDYHFTHPVRATSDLLVRLRDLARDTQVAEAAHTLSLEKLWDTCYTCDEYSGSGSFSFDRKGRYHSCSRGCNTTSKVEPPTGRGGRVQIRRRGTQPQGEMKYEGFWNAESARDILDRITRENVTSAAVQVGQA